MKAYQVTVTKVDPRRALIFTFGNREEAERALELLNAPRPKSKPREYVAGCVEEVDA